MATWASVDLPLRKPAFNVEAVNDNRLHSYLKGCSSILNGRAEMLVNDSLLHHSACSPSG